MDNLARISLLIVLLVAPWLFGGATLNSQVWLYAGVAICTVLWLLGRLQRRQSLQPSEQWTPPLVVVSAALVLTFAAVQLLPVSREIVLRNAVLTGVLGDGHWEPVPASLSIARGETMKEFFRLFLATCVVLMSSTLFRERRLRILLFSLATVNGAVLSIFGLIQKLSWNGKLFWTVPLSHGGQPFASFVNRNNAAGYLNLCLACGFGVVLVMLAAMTHRSNRRSRRSNQRRERRQWTAGILLLLIGIIAVGVIGSASRGGTLALAAMALAAIWISGETRYTRFVLPAVAGIAMLAVGVLAWLGLAGEVGSRLSTLRHIEQLTDARLLHWRDTLRAVPDFPWTGTGLGTYENAHRPYQNHLSSGVYLNADSEYVEWLIEAGIIGFAAAGIFVLSVGWTARTLLSGRYGSPVLDVGAALVLLLVGQLILAATDFGISMVANQLLAAAIIGSAAGRAGSRQRIDSEPEDKRTTISYGEQWDYHLILVGLMMVIGSGLGSYYLWTASQREQFRKSLPQYDQPNEDVLLHTFVALANVRNHHLDDSADGEMQRSIARIHLFRLRMAVLQTLREQAEVGTAEPMLWQRTSPPALLAAMTAIRQSNPQETLGGVLASQEAHDALIQCVEHLHRAAEAEPLLPGVHHLLACLDDQQSTTTVLPHRRIAQEGALAPAGPRRLYELGVIANAAADSTLACQLWRQSLAIDESRSRQTIATAIKLVGETQVLAEAIPPDSPQLLLEFAEMAGTEQRAALKQVATQLTGQSAQTEFWRSRVATLTGDLDVAISHLESAVQQKPFDVDWRLQLASQYEAAGRIDDAIDELTAVANLAASRDDVRKQLLRLKNLKIANEAK